MANRHIVLVLSYFRRGIYVPGLFLMPCAGHRYQVIGHRGAVERGGRAKSLRLFYGAVNTQTASPDYTHSR